MKDLQGRNIEYVRISITDRCNMRCLYCMPEGGVECLSHSELLTYEEITEIVKLLTGMGIHAVRLTGGEPMARRGCPGLIRMLKGIEGIDRLSMTSNGALLKGRMRELKECGLDSLNISLDTLDAETFRRITRTGDVSDVLSAVHEALDCGIRVKLNAVPIKGINEDGLCDVAALARELPIDVRFIELMPIGCGADLTPLPLNEVQLKLSEAFGELTKDESGHGLGPATYVKPAGFKGSIGFISALTHEFCGSCNRIRITPEGQLKLCLNHKSELDLRSMLRSGCTSEEISAAISDTILHKPVHHGFEENISDREDIGMSRIGG